MVLTVEVFWVGKFVPRDVEKNYNVKPFLPLRCSTAPLGAQYG